MLEKMKINLPEELRSVLNEDEKVVYFNKKGLFGGKIFQLITDKRILELEKDTLKEREYLKDGEQVVDLAALSIAIQGRNEHGEFGTRGNLFLITNRRFLLLKFDNLIERNEYEIPFDTIDRIHISRIKAKSFFYGIKYGEGIKILLRAPGAPCSILSHLREIENMWLFLEASSVGSGDYRANLEFFAQTLSNATDLPLSPPERVVVPPELVDKEPKEYLTGTVLEFYTRTDLVWPERCAACLELADEFKYDLLKLKIEKYDSLPVYKDHLEYRIPYCERCFTSRNIKPLKWTKPRQLAVKQYFDSTGINAFVWFENESYAMEFIRVNTR
jgi:hypothetical protein